MNGLLETTFFLARLIPEWSVSLPISFAWRHKQPIYFLCPIGQELLLVLQENVSVKYFYPLIPHFYIAKLGFTGVYLFFLILLQNIDCGYSLELPRRGGSNMYLQSKF